MVPRFRRLCTVFALTLVCLPSLANAQVTAGQVDDFQTGVDNWFFGGGPGGVGATPLTRLLTGGPQGAGDAFLQINSAGSGSGSRLTGSNAAQWSGDYRAAGVTHIGMWVNNFGTTDLSLRLAFEKLGAMGPTDIAFSADAIFISAGSGWQHILFPLLGASLLNFVGSVETAMTDVTLIRLYHSPTNNVPNPIVPIPEITASLGVDDISALVIPEPSTMLLLGTGLVGLAVLRRRQVR